MVSARTLSELENTLAASGLRGPRASALFIGGKILLMVVCRRMVWLLMRHSGISGITGTLLPAGAGVIGLLAPDWVIGQQRKRYLARIEQGLPDALDMMVICAQAGLGLGPAIIRVATELQHAYREIAMEFEQDRQRVAGDVGQPAWRSLNLGNAHRARFVEAAGDHAGADAAVRHAACPTRCGCCRRRCGRRC